MVIVGSSVESLPYPPSLIPHLHGAKFIWIRDLDSNLNRDAEVVPVYTGHSLSNTTKRITLLFIVQTLLHRNPDNIGINVI